MLGAPPALANTRFPVASSDVIGREPPEARATDRPQTGRKGSVNASSREAEARPACWGLLRPARGCGPRASPACRRGTCFTVLTEATPRGWGAQDRAGRRRGRSAGRPPTGAAFLSELSTALVHAGASVRADRSAFNEDGRFPTTSTQKTN